MKKELTCKDYNNKGIIEYNAGQYEYAIIYFDKAILIDPNYIDTYYNRAVAKYNLNQYKESLLDYSKYIELKYKED